MTALVQLLPGLFVMSNSSFKRPLCSAVARQVLQPQGHAVCLALTWPSATTVPVIWMISTAMNLGSFYRCR